jgi:hypothetical protein
MAETKKQKCPFCYSRKTKTSERQNTSLDGEFTTTMIGKCLSCGCEWELNTNNICKQGDPKKRANFFACPCGEQLILNVKEMANASVVVRQYKWKVLLTATGQPVCLCPRCHELAEKLAGTLLDVVGNDDLTIGAILENS